MKAKAHVQFNLVTEAESNKDCCSSSSSKSNTFGPATEQGRRQSNKRYRKGEVPSAFFAMVFTGNSEPLGLPGSWKRVGKKDLALVEEGQVRGHLNKLNIHYKKNVGVHEIHPLMLRELTNIIV